MEPGISIVVKYYVESVTLLTVKHPVEIKESFNY